MRRTAAGADITLYAIVVANGSGYAKSAYGTPHLFASKREAERNMMTGETIVKVKVTRL